MPVGELLCIKNGNYIKWYKSDGSTPIYIPKSNRDYAEALAWRKYYQLQIERKTKELQLLEKYLTNYEKINIAPDLLFENSSCYKELLTQKYKSHTNDPNRWAFEEYEHNSRYQENLIHKSISGHFVRSKSEVIIANSLLISNVPYRYECALHLDDVVFFPDFTILHPKTLEIYYWEHFGMMDSSSYCENSYNKLKILANHGIIPTINLITTYETQKHPIDSNKIQQIINEWFL